MEYNKDIQNQTELHSIPDQVTPTIEVLDTPRFETELPSMRTEQEVSSISYEQSQQHIRDIVETQKITHHQSPISKPLSPKLVKKYGWLLSISEESRVEVAQKLITTKGKDILEVIQAFLAIDDYVGLDRLEESLNMVYPTLIQEGILTDIHNK